MPRWLWFAPLGALAAALAAWGFRMGWIAATITETDVIQSWAAAYVAEQGGQPTDCTARPGRTGPVWIVISCISGDGARFDYPVDRLGRLIDLENTGALPEGPRT